jgi:NuA3 HAT complex component NTO1
MAPIPSTPRRSRPPRTHKSAARPRSGSGKRAGSPTPAIKSEPPPKKRRYVPGGPGGGGRYVDEDGNEEPVGGTGPGGYNYVGPRGRVGQENARKGVQPIVYPRRDRSTRTRTVLPRNQQPPMRFNSSAQAAAAVVQNDGYKPREERSNLKSTDFEHLLTHLHHLYPRMDRLMVLMDHILRHLWGQSLQAHLQTEQ